ncbi:MAG: hypothetical protein ABW157_19865 [Candidatus Thiodiazotropha sp. LLP2]
MGECVEANVELAQISRPQQERLSHIDFRAWFIGQVGRGDIVARFGMGEAAATTPCSPAKPRPGLISPIYRH